MGKYMKKSKATVAVAAYITEAPPHSSSFVGVCTRARAAAALHKPSPPLSPKVPDSSYLQLRSRRLLKVSPPAADQLHNYGGRNGFAAKTASFSVSSSKDVDVGSLGENFLEVEARSTRESKPCSLMRDANSSHSPGSTTREKTHQIIRGQMQRSIPTAHEIDEFFAFAEKQQQTAFMDKYNFDVVNDVPLPGRHEWVPVLN